MITFSLRCEPEGHGFEGWFRSGEDFERQQAMALLSCPVCGTTKVGKSLMAPAVSGTRKAAPPMAPAEMARTFARLQELSREVRRNAEYVGPRFADEARRIHHGEAPERGIYGEATPHEVKGLKEDGIAALPLAPLPEDKN